MVYSSLNNWQSALRKQYIKRDPLASPIGPEPKDDEPQAKVEDEVAEVPEAESTDVSIEEYDEKHLGEQNNTRRGRIPSIDTENSGLHSDESSVHSIRLSSGKHLRGSDTEDAAEERTKQKAPTDWFDLPMITKLESMHTLAEWQFQNATRLRTIMKSDDELASWVRHRICIENSSADCIGNSVLSPLVMTVNPMRIGSLAVLYFRSKSCA